MRREDPGERQQPAGKKRKLNKYEYKRVLEEKKEAKKRERKEEVEENPAEIKIHPIFRQKRVKHSLNNNDQEEEGTEETESRWEEPWTQEAWDARLKEREEEIRREEDVRQERIKKSKRLEQSWELLRLCREIMAEEGHNWKISKERREKEREQKRTRDERLERANKQKEETLKKLETRERQSKITETLGKLPENRRILVERELDKERRVNLKEAREEVWKKWRQSKGKVRMNPKVGRDNNDLEEKLKKVEAEVEKYEIELERLKTKEREK